MAKDDYARIPSNATLPLKPFEAHASDEALNHLKHLLHLSPLAPAVYENTNAGRQHGLTRPWLANAKTAWLTSFNWRACEARINSVPNFTAPVQDADNNTIDLHFIALFSKNPNAVPLAFFHGWPGSICDFLDLLDLLRARYTPEDLPYHVIVPSLPGYAYSSGPPVDADYSVAQAAGALNNLMLGLGFGGGYLVQGGDLGSFMCRELALRYEACKGMHVNMMLPVPAEGDEGERSEEEQRTLEKAADVMRSDHAFALEQATRPATVGLVLSASPLALLGWIGEKFLEWCDEDPPLDKILEAVTLYWLTGTIARALWHSRGLLRGLENPFVAKPSGYSLFAHEIVPVPKSMAAKSCNLVSFREHERGGHFAAMERPAELLDDVEEYVKKVWNKGD